MSTPSQGTSGPNGHAGLQPASTQLLGGNYYAASRPALTQASPEQSMANQVKTLTVRLLTVVSFDAIGTHELSCDTSTIFKRSWRYMRYDRQPCFPDEDPHNPFVEDICD